MRSRIVTGFLTGEPDTMKFDHKVDAEATANHTLLNFPQDYANQFPKDYANQFTSPWMPQDLAESSNLFNSSSAKAEKYFEALARELQQNGLIPDLKIDPAQAHQSAAHTSESKEICAQRA